MKGIEIHQYRYEVIHDDPNSYCISDISFQETGTLWPGQYFSIFNMPDGRAPRGRPSRESIPELSIFIILGIRFYQVLIF